MGIGLHTTVSQKSSLQNEHLIVGADFAVMINDQSLERVQEAKNLGLAIDGQLKFETHFVSQELLEKENIINERRLSTSSPAGFSPAKI